MVVSATGLSVLWWACFSLFFPRLIVQFWAGAAMIVAASYRYSGDTVTLKECFAKAEGRYMQYVMATMLYFLICTAGLLLLAVPGFYLGTMLSLAGYVAVLERRGRAGPLRRSRELVRGSFWRVFLLLLLLGFLAVLGGFIGYGLSKVHDVLGLLGRVGYWVLLWPFWTTVHAVLYHKLKEKEEPAEPPIEPEARSKGKTGCLLGFLAAVGLIIAIVVLVLAWALIIGEKIAEKAENKGLRQERSITFPEDGGHERGESALVRPAQPEKLRQKRMRKHIYTVLDDRAIVFTYGYGVEAEFAEQDRQTFDAEEAVIEDVVAACLSLPGFD